MPHTHMMRTDSMALVRCCHCRYLGAVPVRSGWGRGQTAQTLRRQGGQPPEEAREEIREGGTNGRDRTDGRTRREGGRKGARDGADSAVIMVIGGLHI